MKHFTEELYKKMQLFQLPLEEGLSLQDIEDAFGIEADEFLLQELLARDEWYDAYLPEHLHDRLFDPHGEVCFQQVDDALWQQIAQFRQQTEQQWSKAAAKVQQEKQQIWKTASPALRQLLSLELADSELIAVKGIDTANVQIMLYPQWDLGKRIILQFQQVKDSWMGRFHPDDANWWLVDEILADEEGREGRYVLHVLFGNADRVEQLQFSFSDVVVQEQEEQWDF